MSKQRPRGPAGEGATSKWGSEPGPHPNGGSGVEGFKKGARGGIQMGRQGSRASKRGQEGGGGKGGKRGGGERGQEGGGAVAGPILKGEGRTKKHLYNRLSMHASK